MAIRTIDAPGVEIKEIDKSQYSPAMTGTKVLVTGFANSGEDYIPMIFTSKNAWLNYYGEPKNEAERYFYAASMEVIDQNGVVNCCKLPYDNDSRNKFAAVKYKLNFAQEKTISTVSEQMADEGSDIYKVAQKLHSGECQKYNRDVIQFFLNTYAVTDSTDKVTLQGALNFDILTDNVNTVDRSDDKTGVSEKNFIEVYAGEGISLDDIIGNFDKTLSKSELLGYCDEIITNLDGIMPKLPAFYSIETVQETGLTDCYEQTLSVYLGYDSNAHFAILTAKSDEVNIGSGQLSDFLIDKLCGLVVSDPDTEDDVTDDIFALFEAKEKKVYKTRYENVNGLSVRYQEGYDAIQLRMGVDGCNEPGCTEEDKKRVCAQIIDVIKSGKYKLVKCEPEEINDTASEFFEKLQNDKSLFDQEILDTIDETLSWSEIKDADPTVKNYREITSDDKPYLVTMDQVDEYRTEESRVGTNEIVIIDKTRRQYVKVPEDKNRKDKQCEIIGIIPIVTTAANALYAQKLIEVAQDGVTDYEPIKEITTLSYGDNQTNQIKSDLSGVAIISQRINNDKTADDTPDDFFDSLAIEADGFFSPITLQADGGFDRENMKKIGLVVVQAYLDASEGNKISFQVLESFVGSLERGSKDPNTNATTFIDTIVNENSEYVNLFSNCVPTEAMRNVFDKDVDILVIPHDNAKVGSLGFFKDMCQKDIDISESILKGMDILFDKVSDINERELDIVVDGGVSNIAQFITTVCGGRGKYEPASPEAAVWKCKKDSDVKMWKTVIMKLDNFCKNVRKDCMFIADGPRPFCLQGQRKIIRPSKPTNTIDADILPFMKYLTGINTSYGAGYCNWMQVTDEFSGDYFWCPPSIKICGSYIFTDLNYNYWDAPAGLTRGRVSALDLAFSPTNKQAGQIYTKNWNYCTNYPRDGIVIDGQKTLQTKPTALDRVNVRRLCLRLERATYNVLRYMLFEGNTAYNRQRMVDLLTPYFTEVKLGGGILDFVIKCDETINTAETIDRNELHAQIGIKPVKAIEFIMVDFVILPTGGSWSEL